jgi:iron complex outermembrane receptor protein
MRFYFLAVSLVICHLIPAQECSYKFRGTIKDFHDNSAIADALIYLNKGNRSFVSNNKGEFLIDNLCKGDITLVISHISCGTKSFSFAITKDVDEIILMEQHIEELNEVAVKGSGTKKQTKTAQETILKSKVITKYSALSLGDALKEVPGVSSINTGNAIVKPMINGLYGSRILTITSGVRLQDQEWGVEHAPNIDINGADEISVIKGAGALAYGGDAIGGVIVVKPKRALEKDTLFGRLLLGGQSNGWGYNATSSIQKSYASGWFMALQGSIKQRGDLRAPDYNLTNTGVKSESFSARFGKNTFESGFEMFYSFIKSDIGILRASHIGSIRDLERAINAGQPLIVEDFSYDINVPKQDVKHHLIKAKYYKRLQNFGKLELQYDYQNNRRLEFDVRIGDRRNIPAVDLELQSHSFLGDVTLDNTLERKLKFGILYRYQNNFANPETGVRRLIPDYDKYDAGAYLTGEWRLNSNLLIDAGVRYDFNRIDAKKFYLKSRWEERGYDEDFQDIIIEELATQYLTNPIFDYHNVSASAGMRLKLNSSSRILANYALTSRPPNPSELFSDGLHHAAARFEIGDLRFDQEISNRIGITYSYNKKRLDFSIESYFNNIKDFIYLKPSDFIQTVRGPFPLWVYEQTNAEMFGFDLTVSYAISEAFQYQNKSSFIKGYDARSDVPLIDIPPFTTFNSLNYKQPDWYGLTIGLQNEWVLEQNEYPDFNFSVTDFITEEEVEIDISTPPPAYTLFHLYAEASFPVGKKSSLDLNLSVNNIFDMSYRNYLNRLRFFADEPGRNITLQFKLNF